MAEKALNEVEFEEFAGKLHDKLKTLRHSVTLQIISFLKPYASTLARCSETQIEDLATRNDGFIRKNLLMKVRAYGLGIMAWHLVTNIGITYDSFISLPAKDREKINNPHNPVKLKNRNTVVEVPAEKLTPAQIRKLVSGRRPEKGILSPDEQNEPREYPEGTGPGYFIAESFALDVHGGVVREVILSCRQNHAQCKVRLSLPMLEEIVEKL